jgi:hypothetical protein
MEQAFNLFFEKRKLQQFICSNDGLAVESLIADCHASEQMILEVSI